MFRKGKKRTETDFTGANNLMRLKIVIPSSPREFVCRGHFVNLREFHVRVGKEEIAPVPVTGLVNMISSEFITRESKHETGLGREVQHRAATLAVAECEHLARRPNLVFFLPRKIRHAIFVTRKA